MATRAGSILIDMFLRTGTFVTDSKTAEQAMKKLRKEAEEFGKKIGIAFAAAGTAVAIYAKSQINQLDALNDLSDATGSTVENLSALEDVARRNGQTLDDVSGIVVKFNKALSDVDGKNEASQAFAKLGLNFKELQQLDPAEALRQTAVALAGFADDGNKARLVQELFGKSIKEAGPFLKDLAEQGQLNAKVTTEQAKAAEEFNKNIFGLEKNVADLARRLLSDLIPALNQVFADIKEGGFLEFLDKIDRAVGLSKGGTAAEQLIEKLSGVNEQIASIQKRVNDANKSDNSFAKAGIPDLEKQLASLRAEAAKTEAEMVKLDATLSPKNDPRNYSNEGRNKRSVGVISKDKPGPKETDPFDALIKSAREMLAVAKATGEAEGDLSDAQRTGVKIAADLASGTLKLKDSQFALLAVTLDQADAAQRENEQKKRGAEATREAISAREALLQSEKSSTTSMEEEARASRLQLAQFGKTAEAIETEDIARQRVLATSKELLAIRREEKDDLDPIAAEYRNQAKAIRDAANAREQLLAKQVQLDTDPLTGATKAVQDYLDITSKAGRATYDVVRSAADGIENILVDAFTGKDVKQQAKQLVNQLIAEIYRLAVVKPFLASIMGSGGSGSGLGGLISLVGRFFGSGNLQLGGAGGTTITPQLVGEFATGTDYVPKTGLAKVHEGERILTKDENRAGNLGGNIVEINNYSGQPVRNESGRRGDKRLTRVMIGEIVRDSRRGGAMRQATREAVGPRLRRG